MKTCTIEGCEKRHVARGLCSGHYQSAKKGGVIEQFGTTAPPPSPACLWCRADVPGGHAFKRYCDEVCRQRAASHREACAVFPHCDHERPRFGKAHLPLRERLFRHIDRTGGSEACWLWTGTRNDRGYGQTYVRRNGERVTTGAHRAMYIAVYGDIPDDLFVLHSCDNPPCCNPRHLRCGDQIQNMADRREHGAGYLQGDEHPVAIEVPPETVAAIRAAYRYRAKGRTQHDLAARFGLSRSTVQRIVTQSDRWERPA